MRGYPDKTKELLFNLAIRYRMARRYASERRGNVPHEVQHFLDGQMIEAHNSFQAAKQILWRTSE